MSLQNIPFTQIGSGNSAKPWLQVVIINPHAGKQLSTYGLIDTGADECALPASFAEVLGHDLQKGVEKEILTGNGITVAYSHTVSIEANGFNTENVLIDFMPNLSVPLLGVRSFLSKFILTINYKGQNFTLQLND